MWILTAEYNSYDQEGEYFVAVFKSKPTKEDLKFIKKDFVDHGLIEHVLSGGGRRNYEHRWYNLFEATAGKNYHEE